MPGNSPFDFFDLFPLGLRLELASGESDGEGVGGVGDLFFCLFPVVLLTFSLDF